jgi:hypothetical protein
MQRARTIDPKSIALCSRQKRRKNCAISGYLLALDYFSLKISYVTTANKRLYFVEFVINEMVKDAPKMNKADMMARLRRTSVINSRMPGKMSQTGIMNATSALSANWNFSLGKRNMLGLSVLA